MEISIGSVALAPVIAALVEGAKALGLPSRFAPFLNAILSVVAYLVVSVYLVQHPDALAAATVMVNALVIFLTAAGFYTTTRFVVASGSQ